MEHDADESLFRLEAQQFFDGSGEAGLRLWAQLTGCEPCDRCDFLKHGCRCHNRGED